jgi:hypothetical protein
VLSRARRLGRNGGREVELELLKCDGPLAVFGQNPYLVDTDLVGGNLPGDGASVLIDCHARRSRFKRKSDDVRFGVRRRLRYRGVFRSRATHRHTRRWLSPTRATTPCAAALFAVGLTSFLR